MIQSLYKNHKTWAQFEEEKKNLREKYFQTKMDEKFMRDDIDKEFKLKKKAIRNHEIAEVNKHLVEQRSHERIMYKQDEFDEDKNRLTQQLRKDRDQKEKEDSIKK